MPRPYDWRDQFLYDHFCIESIKTPQLRNGPRAWANQHPGDSMRFARPTAAFSATAVCEVQLKVSRTTANSPTPTPSILGRLIRSPNSRRPATTTRIKEPPADTGK